MDKRDLQTYSTWAKENLENQIEVSLKALGINDENNIKQAKKVGDVTTIEGDPTSYPADLFGKRERIIELVKRQGYQNVIEEFAYTWFNRFVALHFMEVHGFLPHGFRMLSNPAGGIEPEVLKNLNLVKDDLKLDMNLCAEYKQQGKIEELFRHVLIRQCNVLSGILPMLFSSDMGYLELLLPANLLKGDTVITRLNEIPEAAFMEDVEIIGWMYQFYISSKKDAVYASKQTITKDTLPAVTQLFTPDWIVRYMAQNSVGRLWLESYPNSTLRSEMRYYVEDVPQTAEVQKKIDEIRYRNVNPEDIRIIEPCCGSGHILVYVFDLLYKMYEERGYQKRDIPTLILKKNLVGLDVDKRAVQLASFSLIMKARSVNNRFFTDQYYETPHVYELQDSKLLKDLGYCKQLKDLNLLNDEEIKMIMYLVDTFENGKTIGSLLKVKPIDFECLDGVLDKVSKDTVSNLFNSNFLNIGIKRLKELSNLAKILSAKYDVMITNPPYIGTSSLEMPVKDFALKHYSDSKGDLCTMFMETEFVRGNGFIAMINMHSWMFLSRLKNLRNSIASTCEVINMVHLGPRAFEEINGEVVQTVTFVMRKTRIKGFEATYIRLVDYLSEKAKEKEFHNKLNANKMSTEIYDQIPGNIFIYWKTGQFIKNFENKLIGDVINARVGLDTGNNDKYIRQWYEVNREKIIFDASSAEQVVFPYKWVPHTKGGSYRKWYGNFECVIAYDSTNYERLLNSGNHLPSRQFYFLEGITWSRVSTSNFAVRYTPKGMIFNSACPTAFADSSTLMCVLGLLNSKVVKAYVTALSPTINFQAGDIDKVPYIVEKNRVNDIRGIVWDNIESSKSEWDSFETSWLFSKHPLIIHKNGGLISDAYNAWETESQIRYNKLKANEEELNRIFIDLYGLQDELAPEVEDKDVTVRLADKGRDIRSLISYLVGVAMGRYSLDVPGLAYAGGEWDASKYITYQPDDDGIIPIYSSIGMEDGLTTVLIKLIKQIYGEDTYRRNIDFIAEALGKNNNESSEETLNRYLNDGFYADHLKIYQKRPIYWLFSSGKKAGFKCLIYMHRYNEDTLARINGKYFLPESTRKKNELGELNGRIAHAEGRDKLKLEKERYNLAAAYNEAIEYGQILDYMANKYISIDLDDGVKVNYAKFQGVEIVTNGGSKVKKDLLAALK